MALMLAPCGLYGLVAIARTACFPTTAASLLSTVAAAALTHGLHASRFMVLFVLCAGTPSTS